VAEVLATIVPRVRRLLERRGMGEGDEGAGVPDGWAEDAPVLAGIAAASVQGTFALGSRAGRRVRRCGAALEQDESPARARCHARQEGFDLHAGVRVRADERDRLERLCRYVLRPPVAQDRLHLTAEGQVLLQLRHPWSDGTTHLLFDPLELLERLAVLIPRPRINLILYHGVLPFDVAQGTPSMVEGWGRGPRGPSTLLRTIPSHVEGWRALVVGFGNTADPGETSTTEPDAPAPRWADLMRRSFGIDTLACPRCPGRLRLIALIEEPSVIERILRHLCLPTEVPTPRPGRAPSLGAARDALSQVDGRRSSWPDPSTRTRGARPSTRAPDRCPPVPTRRRYGQSSSGAPRAATSSLTRWRSRR
jgi:hypothetical protein